MQIHFLTFSVQVPLLAILAVFSMFHEDFWVRIVYVELERSLHVIEPMQSDKRLLLAIYLKLGKYDR